MLKTYNFASKVIIYCLVKGCRKAFLFKSRKKETFRRKWKGGRQLSLSRILSLFPPFSAEKQSRTAAFSNGFFVQRFEGKRGRQTIFHFRICQSVKSDNSQFPSPLRAKTNHFLRKKSLMTFPFRQSFCGLAVQGCRCQQTLSRIFLYLVEVLQSNFILHLLDVANQPPTPPHTSKLLTHTATQEKHSFWFPLQI